MKRLFVIALLVILLVGRPQVGMALAETVVEPANMNGWAFAQEPETPGTGYGNFAPGPGIAPLGDGSARLGVDSTGRWLLSTPQFSSTRLDAITSLSYKTFRSQGSGEQAIALQFNIDYDLTDTNVAWQGRLVFEPYMNGAVASETWQTWSPMTGKWWASGAPGNTLCGQSSPCTFEQVKTNWPDAGLRANNEGYVIFKAGGPWAGGFVGNVDAFTIGINGVETIVNFEPADTVYVDDNWALLDPGVDPDGTGPAHAMGLDAFTKVQGGVDSVGINGKVNVAAGTYIEQVTIHYPLTLTGAGVGQTIVQAPPYADRNRLPRINRIFDYAVGAVNVNGVTVEALTVDVHREGAPTCISTERGGGVFFIGSNATLQNARIIDAAQADAQYGCQDSAWSGVLAIGDSGLAVNQVTVKNVTVERFQKNGITAYATSMGGLNASIENNTITTVQEARTAQNGIQVSSGAGGVLKGNTITNVFYTGTTPYVATAVLVMNNAPLAIQNNTILNSQLGVYLYGGPGSIEGNTVTSALPANFEGLYPYYGLVVTDPPGVVPSPFEAPVKQAVQSAPQGEQAAEILDILVANNVLTGGSDAVGSIGIEADSGYDAFDTNITMESNVIRGWGSGIAVMDCTESCTTSKFLSVTANFNSIVNNTIGLQNSSIVSVNAENNWWGCNAGPNDEAGDCDTVESAATAGAVDYDPWLKLTLTSNVSQVLPAQPGTLQASLATNSAGQNVSASGSLADFGSVAFTTTVGTLNAASVPLVDSAANATLSVSNAVNHTVTTVTAAYDNQVVSLDLGIGLYKVFSPIIQR